LALLRELGHTHGVGIALTYLGVVAVREGDVERAMALQADAISVWQDLGDRDEEASALINLGAAVRLAGDPHRAAALMEEGRRLF
jgi:hypothetical protein